MSKSYSIAEARDKFAKLVRSLEQIAKPVQVTRRGKPVAVILSIREYERLQAKQSQKDFWQSYQAWRQTWQVDEWEDDEGDPFANLRDKSPGREIDL